jgi:hypothetical protein
MVPPSRISYTLKMETIRSSETSANTIYTAPHPRRRHSSLLSCWFPVRFILRPWRQERHVLSKRLLTCNGLHGSVSQKIVPLRNSNHIIISFLDMRSEFLFIWNYLHRSRLKLSCTFSIYSCRGEKHYIVQCSICYTRLFTTPQVVVTIFLLQWVLTL